MRECYAQVRTELGYKAAMRTCAQDKAAIRTCAQDKAAGQEAEARLERQRQQSKLLNTGGP